MAIRRMYKKSEASKKALLDAALELAGEKGYEGASIRDICAKAGLSIGAFYHHYGSKDGLLNESFIYFDNTITEEAERRYDAMNPVEAIKAVLIDQTAFTESIGVSLMREYYRALLQEKGEGAIAANRMYYKTVKKHVEMAQSDGLLQSGTDAMEIAEFLIKHVRGNLLDWCLHDGGYNVTERTQKELDKILETYS